MKIPNVLTELGCVLEITYETKNESITFSFPKIGNRKMVLTCNGQGTKLFCMRQGKAKKSKLSELQETNASSRYETWSGYEVNKIRKVRVSEKKTKRVGNVTEIVYYSDKWDGWHEYIHTFKNKTQLEIDNDTDPIIMSISGSKLKITARGIEG